MTHPTLIIEGDPDDSGTVREARFELTAGSEQDGGLSIGFEQRTGYITEGTGKLIQTLVSEFDGFGQGANLGVFTNLGTGQNVWTISASTWEGSDQQWGDGGSDPKTDGTGEDPQAQLSVLSYWIRNTRPDSLPEGVPGSSASAATLEVGEYHPDGRYGPLKVVLESPSIDFSASRPSEVPLSLTCIEAADLEQTYDALARTVRGSDA